MARVYVGAEAAAGVDAVADAPENFAGLRVEERGGGSVAEWGLFSFS